MNHDAQSSLPTRTSILSWQASSRTQHSAMDGDHSHCILKGQQRACLHVVYPHRIDATDTAVLSGQGVYGKVTAIMEQSCSHSSTSFLTLKESLATCFKLTEMSRFSSEVPEIFLIFLSNEPKSTSFPSYSRTDKNHVPSFRRNQPPTEPFFFQNRKSFYFVRKLINERSSKSISWPRSKGAVAITSLEGSCARVCIQGYDEISSQVSYSDEYVAVCQKESEIGRLWGWQLHIAL